MGAAASVVLNHLLKEGPTPGTDPAGQPLPLEAQQARTALIGTIVTTITQATGQDAGAALAAARIETTNNALRMPDGSLRVIKASEASYGIAQLVGKDAEFKALMDEAAKDPRFGGDTAKLEAEYQRYTMCKAAATGCETKADPLLDMVGQLYGAEVAFIGAQEAYDAKACGGATPLTCGIQRANAYFRSPDGVRFAGAMDILTGLIGVGGGTLGAIGGAAGCPESLGAGCGLAAASAATVATSGDQIATGWKKLITGTPQASYGGEAIARAFGVSPQAGETIYAGANLGLGLVTGHLGTSSVPQDVTAAAKATLADEAANARVAPDTTMPNAVSSEAMAAHKSEAVTAAEIE